MRNYKFLLVVILILTIKVKAQNMVTSTNDLVNPFSIVLGELRCAIDSANARLGLDYISFNIPGSALHHIALNSGLPTITEGIIMDGNTQLETLTNGTKKINIIGNSGSCSLLQFNYQTLPNTIKDIELSTTLTSVVKLLTYKLII